jgi:Mn-dependent DtxR family transcriptional regulator
MGARPREVEESLRTLAAQGLVRNVSDDQWALTEAGVAAAQRLVNPYAILPSHANQVTQAKEVRVENR